MVAREKTLEIIFTNGRICHVKEVLKPLTSYMKEVGLGGGGVRDVPTWLESQRFQAVVCCQKTWRSSTFSFSYVVQTLSPTKNVRTQSKACFVWGKCGIFFWGGEFPLLATQQLRAGFFLYSFTFLHLTLTPVSSETWAFFSCKCVDRYHFYLSTRHAVAETETTAEGAEKGSGKIYRVGM